MADSQRIDDLRRRVQKDPASIAFAQLAEELRRAGQYQESVDICREGLEIHPAYLSARVTLGRSLLELNRLDEAAEELGQVLKSAPDNLAAIRGVGEIFMRRGMLREALDQFRAALTLAKNDPDLEMTVTELARKVEPKQPAAATEGLTFEQAQDEFLKNLPPPAAVNAPKPAPVNQDTAGGDRMPVAAGRAPETRTITAEEDRERTRRTVAALEVLLDSLNGPRTEPRP